MWYLLLGALVLILPGLWVLSRLHRELGGVGGFSRTTFLLAFIAFVGHVAITAATAWAGVWPLAVPRALAWGVGGAMALIGAAVHGLARFRFGSFRLAWGLSTERLITDGIYRFSRNPQCLGWILIELGMGIAGRSGAALLLATIFIVAVCVWLPREEAALRARFGEEYERYCRRARRILGWRRERGSPASTHRTRRTEPVPIRTGSVQTTSFVSAGPLSERTIVHS